MQDTRMKSIPFQFISGTTRLETPKKHQQVKKHEPTNEPTRIETETEERARKERKEERVQARVEQLYAELERTMAPRKLRNIRSTNLIVEVIWSENQEAVRGVTRERSL
jgi:hypothetical protein